MSRLLTDLNTKFIIFVNNIEVKTVVGEQARRDWYIDHDAANEYTRVWNSDETQAGSYARMSAAAFRILKVELATDQWLKEPA